MEKDYYKIMGLSKDATAKDIKTAYRKLARKYHPDVNKEADAEEKFKELGEAYEVLKDPNKRLQYDQYVRDWKTHKQSGYTGQQANWQQAQAGFEFNDDFFESIFGQRPFREQQFSGSDYRSQIEISLEEACKGVVKEIQLPIPGSRENRLQTLRVKIPAGIKSGQQIRLPGQGGESPTGGAKGDLYLTVHVKKHRYFDVKNNDVYLTLPVTPWEAALGTKLKVPTLSGMVELKIPKGTQGGQTLKLKGKGLPTSPAGDFFVMIKIMTPKPHGEASEALYRQMAEVMPFNPREKMGL